MLIGMMMHSQQRAARVRILGQEGRERVARGDRWLSGRTPPPMGQSRLSWVGLAAAVAFLIVVGLPIFLLLLLAVTAAALVLGVMAAAGAVMTAVRGARRVEDGRENVRVIDRRD